MLFEVSHSLCNYFVDQEGWYQGEFKSWHNNGQLEVQCFYVDNKVHGEYKVWWPNGILWEHCFYINGEYVPFNEIPYPTTNEELMLFKLKYNLQLLPQEQ